MDHPVHWETLTDCAEHNSDCETPLYEVSFSQVWNVQREYSAGVSVFVWSLHSALIDCVSVELFAMKWASSLRKTYFPETSELMPNSFHIPDWARPFLLFFKIFNF